MQNEQSPALRKSGRLGDIERQLIQSKLDVKYFRQKLEGLEEENIRLSRELRDEKTALRASDNDRQDKIAQITALNNASSLLNAQLAENKKQLKKLRDHPIRNAIESLIYNPR